MGQHHLPPRKCVQLDGTHAVAITETPQNCNLHPLELKLAGEPLAVVELLVQAHHEGDAFGNPVQREWS